MNAHLATYINDHLAGAAGAIELMGHVVHEHADSPAALVVATLKGQVEEERRELEGVLHRIGGKPGVVRKTAGWLAERALEIKLRINDPGDGSFRLFEALEAISIGVEGKNSLWRALSSLTGSIAELRGPDYDFLINRGNEQRAALEPMRLMAAAGAFEQRSTNER